MICFVIKAGLSVNEILDLNEIAGINKGKKKKKEEKKSMIAIWRPNVFLVSHDITVWTGFTSH